MFQILNLRLQTVCEELLMSLTVRLITDVENQKDVGENKYTTTDYVRSYQLTCEGGFGVEEDMPGSEILIIKWRYVGNEDCLKSPRFFY